MSEAIRDPNGRVDSISHFTDVIRLTSIDGEVYLALNQAIQSL